MHAKGNHGDLNGDLKKIGDSNGFAKDKLNYITHKLCDTWQGNISIEISKKACTDVHTRLCPLQE